MGNVCPSVHVTRDLDGSPSLIDRDGSPRNWIHVDGHTVPNNC